jgi:hypothetical protein
VLIVENDAEVVERDLAAGRFACPTCLVGVLGRWGSARRRALRDGEVFRPRRAICRSCLPAVTHVLLPDTCLLRRRDRVEVIGAALTAAIGGNDPCEAVADRLGLPAETVRGWLRRFRRRAEAIRSHFAAWLAVLAPGGQAPQLRGSVALDALETIGAAARAASLALSQREPWSWVSRLSGGRLLVFNANTPWPMPS